MKKAQHLIPLLIIAVIVAPYIINHRGDFKASANRWVNYSFCDRTIKYRINDIDSKFDISKEELSLTTKEATNIWNNAWQKPIFELDEEGALQVNLVYDDRQSFVSNINDLGNKVEQQKKQLSMTNTQYEQMKSSINAEVKKLNDAIDYWNKQGGAPKEEYEKLIKQQKEVQDKIEELNNFGNKINQNVDKVNQQVHSLNENVETFNSLINLHPEEGTYTSGENKIDIYFYASREELIHVLAHEFGHALGLGHIEEKDAIMNPISSTNTKITQADTQALVNFCSNKNRLDLIKNDIINVAYTLISKVTAKTN